MYHINMVKYVESGISGRDLGFHYLRWIKELAVKYQIKGMVFTIPGGSIKVVAKGEEKDLIEFTYRLEKESYSRNIENFYIKWCEPNQNSEGFHVVLN